MLSEPFVSGLLTGFFGGAVVMFIWWHRTEMLRLQREARRLRDDIEYERDFSDDPDDYLD